MSRLEPENGALDDPLDAIEHLGIPRTRIRLLHLIQTNPGATVSFLALETGFSRNGIQPHLDVLESLGLVSNTRCRVRGSFRPAACYEVDSARVQELAWLIFDAMLAETRIPLEV